MAGRSEDSASLDNSVETLSNKKKRRPGWPLESPAGRRLSLDSGRLFRQWNYVFSGKGSHRSQRREEWRFMKVGIREGESKRGHP